MPKDGNSDTRKRIATLRSTHAADGHGLKCPTCGSIRLRVIDSRAHSGTIRRRRVCKGCNRRFYTMETVCTFACVATDGGVEPSA